MLERKRSGWGGDLVRGLASGLVASWIMERAQAQLGKLGSTSKKERERRATSDEPATVKTAEAIAERLGRRLGEDQKARAGALVHDATGAGWGAVYGLPLVYGSAGARILPGAARA